MDSNYNLQSLISRIKTRLKDAEYDDDTIAQFINDTYFEILGDTHYQFLEKKYRASAQEGGPLLLPKDYQSIIHLTARLDKKRYPLRYKPSREFFDFGKNSSFNNYTYTIFGNELHFSLPNIENEKDEDGDEKFYELDLYYLAKPLTLTGTARPVIPQEYSEAIVLGALARAEQLRDNFDYAQVYENKKEDIVLSMKERYCPRQLEGENRAQLPVMVRTRY